MLSIHETKSEVSMFLKKLTSLVTLLALSASATGCATRHVIPKDALSSNQALLTPKRNRSFKVVKNDRTVSTSLKKIYIENNLVRGQSNYGNKDISIPMEDVKDVKVKDFRPIASILSGIGALLGIIVLTSITVIAINPPLED